MSAKTAVSRKSAAAPAAKAAPPPSATQIQPYLFFEGRCDEAAEFYRRVLGAEVVMLMRYKDNPVPPEPGQQPPGKPDKVMHMELRIAGATILASDGHCAGTAKFQGFGLSLTVGTVAEAERYYHGLTDGGQVLAPLGKTFFSERFGMVADRFGVMWMVYVAPAGA